MKSKKVLTLAALLGLSANSASVFATNQYNIEYTGGEQLSSSIVHVEPSLKDLTSLQKFGKDQNNQIEFSSSQWKSAFLKTSDGKCNAYHYISFDGDPKEHDFSGVYYTITSSDNSYSTKVQIDKVVVDGSWSGTRKFDIGVDTSGGIGAGHGQMLYKESTCTTRVDENGDGIKMPSLKTADGIKLFIQTNIKINKHGEAFTSDEMYFGIMDIDAAQSYKILNSGSELSSNSMYAMSDAAFVTKDGLHNMFVSGTGKNYIYSEFNDSGHFDATGGDIYAKIDRSVQQSGLQMVFGYMTGAGSGVEYYAKQYVVKYESDKGGQISGKTTEDVVSGDTASGTSVKTESGYEFGYWVADKDVVLEDGTKIKAGDKITSEQLKQVVVNGNITFTAKNIDSSSAEVAEKSAVNTPNTGSFTEGSNGLIYTIGLAIPVGFAMVALIKYAVKRNMQKVSFKK